MEAFHWWGSVLDFEICVALSKSFFYVNSFTHFMRPLLIDLSVIMFVTSIYLVSCTKLSDNVNFQFTNPILDNFSRVCVFSRDFCSFWWSLVDSYLCTKKYPLLRTKGWWRVNMFLFQGKVCWPVLEYRRMLWSFSELAWEKGSL